MTTRPFLLATLACAALALPLAPAAQTPAQPPAPLAPAPRTIHVSGDGRVTVSPDVAVLFAGVEATGRDLPRVTQDAAAQMKRIMAALAEAGIPQKDVQTAQHDVQVERSWQKSRPGPITGYTVSDRIRITVRDLARLGPALDRITAAGANSVHSLTFQKDDPSPERARALAAAYGVARAKAEALARAAGVTLGDVLQLSESTQAPPMPLMRAAAMKSFSADAETPVAAGEVEITATVDVVYGIK